MSVPCPGRDDQVVIGNSLVLGDQVPAHQINPGYLREQDMGVALSMQDPNASKSRGCG